MSDLKPRGVPIVLEGVGERNLLFDFNAIDVLQQKYDKNIWEILNDVVSNGTKMGAGDNVSMLRFIVFTLLNAERDRMKDLHDVDIPEVTERAVGGMLGQDNYADVLRAVLVANGLSMPEPDESQSPNATGGQRKN